MLKLRNGCQTRVKFRGLPGKHFFCCSCYSNFYIWPLGASSGWCLGLSTCCCFFLWALPSFSAPPHAQAHTVFPLLCEVIPTPKLSISQGSLLPFIGEWYLETKIWVENIECRINSHKYYQLIFYTDVKIPQWRNTTLFNKLFWNDWSYAKKKELQLHFFCKNKLKFIISICKT